MFEKCLKCARMGESCVPNIMLLPFAELIQWCDKRQKHLNWTNQTLAERSNVPIGTINRIKEGKYRDCKYSTIKHLLIALIGGTADEFSCTEQVARELQQVGVLEQQAKQLEQQTKELEQQIELLKLQLKHKDEIIAIHNYYNKIKSND